ncbi:MAG TPA: hypothetical protein VKN35_03580 [Xanthomonadales bacterium]|nr:hypothetical protein [Xanthomonadales bacterium]
MKVAIQPLSGTARWGALLALVLLVACAPTRPPEGVGRADIASATAEARETRGASYPPSPMPPPDFTPNLDERFEPVPTGEPRGNLQPANPAIRVIEADLSRIGDPDADSGMEAPDAPKIRYKDYAEVDDAIPTTSSCCPEPSVAENGQTIMMTGNVWMALSEDGGTSFNSLNPTTVFPQDDGGLCCDQVVQYVPQIDMFIWLMQYRSKEGRNRIRIAAQTTNLVRSSNGTAWTYWDFTSNVFSDSGTLDYNDMSFGRSNLYWTSQINGRVVVRVPLSQIAAKSTINYGYTAGTDAKWSHVTHNPTDTVYWAGHINNSQLRVYSMRDGDGFYSWRTVNINSWPNSSNSSIAPDGTDWMTFELNKHYVYGNARQGGNVWFGWLASKGGGFPHPHVQLVKISTSSFTLQDQVQVWNPDFAFIDPYLSTNAENELGMAIAFGGGPFFASHAVGVWGDFVVYYPRLSTRATSRWGDYTTSRRSGSNSMEWVAAGYTNETDGSGTNVQIPHYIRFAR